MSRKFSKWDGASLAERYAAKVDVRGLDECWPWTGTINASTGYGVISIGTRDEGDVGAHRLAWELANGPIHEGMTVEHRCHTEDMSCWEGDECMHRRCQNPGHLELLTMGENSRRKHNANARKTHCKFNHPFDEANTYTRKGGERLCRACSRERTRERRRRQ